MYQMTNELERCRACADLIESFNSSSYAATLILFPVYEYSSKTVMTILPTAKPKKIRKEERRGVDEWSATQSGQTSQSLRTGMTPSNCFSLPAHSPHSSHHPSLSPPLRKVPRKGGIPSSISILPSSSFPSTSQASPRGSREDKVGSAKKEDGEGPNSDDEYDRGFRDEEMENNFERRLRDERGLEIRKMVGDGACLFRGVSHQIYGDEDMHGEVRRLCLDYMEKNREHFEQFITEDFAAYIARKRRLSVHGNHVELQAISEIYNRPIEIYEYNINPINVFHPKTPGGSNGGPGGSHEKREGEQINAPIRLSYHGSTHYNAVIDPRVATVGVGLGLPSYEPGLADRQLVADAISKSEMHQIEQAMLNDKMSMTDWERTEEDLKDQVLRASYVEYARSLEVSNEPSTSSSSRSLPSLSRSIASSSHSTIPFTSHPSSSSKKTKMFDRTSSTTAATSEGPCDPPKESTLYEELLIAEALEWNDETNYETTLAEALLISQQTFLTECRRRPDGEGGSKE